MPPATHEPTGLLECLREGTRAEHRAIERTFAELTSSALTHERYRFRVGQLYGFYLPLEAQLTSVLRSDLLDLRARVKTQLLQADLQALGVRRTGALPICPALPALDDDTACFGCLYVLEGSTLGGRLISRNLQRCLGVTPARGGRFFAGYGPATGAMWSAFRAALLEHTERSGCFDRVVDAALATFASLRAWCDRPPELRHQEGAR